MDPELLAPLAALIGVGVLGLRRRQRAGAFAPGLFLDHAGSLAGRATGHTVRMAGNLTGDMLQTAGSIRCASPGLRASGSGRPCAPKRR